MLDIFLISAEKTMRWSFLLYLLKYNTYCESINKYKKMIRHNRLEGSPSTQVQVYSKTEGIFFFGDMVLE